MSKRYLFIIDTDSYAGNFEREMCAFVTGHVGECGVGSNHADSAIAERFEEIIEYENQNGCERPVEMCSNLNGLFQGVSIFFNEMPSNEDILFLKERSKEYEKVESIKVLGFRLGIKETIIVETIKDI